MINRIINTARDTKRTLYVEKVLKGRLEWFENNMTGGSHVMSSEMKRDYIEYYRSFGFRHVSTKWIELIYGVTGQYDRRMVPEDIFNLYIDPVYPDIRDYWQNKSYQPSIVPGLRYPETVVRRINGYFVNSNHEIISERDALRIVQKQEAVVIKPTIFTGGGINVRFFNGRDVEIATFNLYGKDFIVQKRMAPGKTMSTFNERTVCTDKIVSFLFRGKVYILLAFFRIAASGADTDNCCESTGNTMVAVKDDGTLCEYGYDGMLNKVHETKDGVVFSGANIPYHKKSIEIIKKAHQRLLNFPIVSWDFTEGEDGKPVLIEYNLKWHSVIPFQTLCGPMFGEITDDVLREAAARAKASRSLFYK